MKLVRFLRLSPLVGCALVPVLTPGCAKPDPPPAHVAVEPAPTDLVVLPNNTSVRCSAGRVVALKATGEIAWELALPDGDTLAAPAAAAGSSVLYVRGRKALYAAAPDGKWLWSKDLEAPAPGTKGDAAGPVAMTDSTAVVLSGRELVRLDAKGAQRWKVTLPEGSVTTRLAAAMDGSLIVSTSAGVYGVRPDGSIAWRRVLGG
jgi:hypothetical protein